MAEKQANIRHNRNFGAVGTILQPFFIYLVVYFTTAVILTYLVNAIAQKAGGMAETLFTEQEATVNAVIGGIAMLIGILPLLSDFKHEIKNDNIGNRKGNRKKEKEKENEKGKEKEKKEREDEKTALNNERDEMWISLCRAMFTIVLAFTSSIAINILFITLHLTENSESYSQVAEHQYGVLFPIGLFLYGIVSPLAEEIVFRGIIYNRMKKILPVLPSLILSALLFGLYHGNAVQALYGFLMGMLIAYTYEKCGSFSYAFLFHAAANAAVYMITGNPVLYERFITPHNGMIFAGISVLLLLFWQFGHFFHRFQSPKAE